MTVTAGTAVSYGCINTQQRALVAQSRGALGATVPSQNSPAPALGVYNQAALRQQYGGNFGHSAVPERPPPPVYASPLIPR